MRTIGALLLLSMALGQQPARDPSNRSTPPTGTASITGKVVTDEGAGQPIRRARVTLTSTDASVVLAEMTDDAGAFLFRDLPAGRYSLSASKPAWLTTNYGAARPRRPGTPMAVADGARLTGVTLRMARGAVITGVVRDVTGQPAAGVRVQVSKLGMRNGERYLEGVARDGGGPVETDDTGTYRLFGLPPGDVIVSAVLQSTVVSRSDAGAFVRATPEEIARANQLVRQGGSEPIGPGPAVKLAMVFYPGTTDPNGAAVVSLAAAEERTGIDLTMQIVPTSRVEGVVLDAAGTPQPQNTVVAVSGGIQLGSLMGLNGVTSATTGRNGQYQLTGLAPGEYTLMSGGNNTWAEANIVVSGQDLTVPLTVQPYLSMTGRVIFEGAANPPPGILRYSLEAYGSLGSLMALATTGTVSATDNDRTFSSEIVPSRYRIQFTGVPAGWYPKSAITRGQDVFDLPVTIGPNDRQTEFLITFTDKPSELTGSLVDAGGRPASEYFVVVFSTDRRYWTPPSRRVVQLRPGSDGAFSTKGLPAGDYFIGALTDIEPGESLTADFLASLVASTPPVQVKIVDGQRTTQTLKLGGG